MQNRSAVIAWNGLPGYAARLLSGLSATDDFPIHLIGSDCATPRCEIERIVGRSVTWADPWQPLRWSDVHLEIPQLFIHTGWAYPGFNSLARSVKRSKGSVVSMIDNNRKRNFRQLCGALGFRLAYRGRIDAAWVPGESGQELTRFLDFSPPRRRRLFRNRLPSLWRQRRRARRAAPLAPPSFPSATAAGFFPASASGKGDPSKRSPMDSSTICRAIRFKSFGRDGLLDRLGVIGLCHRLTGRAVVILVG